jgi:hypothetical protein
MLTYPQENRISAEEALKHPWFSTKNNLKIDSALVKRLTTFNVKMKRATKGFGTGFLEVRAKIN